jgi:hypothetical protein
MIRADGFVMLGKTVPEPSRRQPDRTYVCSAGWQPDLGLIRIYPLGVAGAPPRWSTSSVHLERNPEDSRAESWRLPGDRRNPRINNAFEQAGTLHPAQRPHLLPELGRWTVGSIGEANERRMSLAVIHPEHIQLRLDIAAGSADSPQLSLFDVAAPPGRRFDTIPRLVFPGGHNGGMLMRDWGCFEWMRKHPGNAAALTDALHLSPATVLLIGNLANHRNTWIVISALNIAQPQGALPLGLDPTT